VSLIINPYAFGGGGGAATLTGLISADIATYGGIYMRLNETSGTSADDQASGTNGSYNNAWTLNNTAIYSGGPGCARSTASGSSVSFPGSAVPALSAMTIGVVWKPAALTGIRQIISRDNDAGPRHFQFRTNGTSLEFYNLVGGLVEGTTVAHGMTAGNAYLVMVSVSSSGSVKIFRTGTKLATGSATGVNYGGSSASHVCVGGRNAVAEGHDCYWSEAFVIAGDLSESRVAAYATASGL
jgi:hypothetical protein